MGKRKGNQLHMETLAVLLLFLVFATLVLSVLLTGARVYKGLVERDGASYQRRTAAQYLATKVRQSDRSGAVSVSDFGGVPALEITEDIDGDTYVTRIYCYDGAIRELFALGGVDFSPVDGEVILEAQSMDLRQEGDLLTASISLPDGSAETLQLHLRTEGGAP